MPHDKQASLPPSPRAPRLTRGLAGHLTGRRERPSTGGGALFALAAAAMLACGGDAPSEADVAGDAADTADATADSATDTVDAATDPDGSTELDAADDAGDADTDGSGDAPVEDTGPVARPYPEPDAWPANRGPGGPRRTFTEEELYVNCATLDGGEQDYADHHNLVTMYDGYLLMPWAPEWGGGGITLYDISDPCAPTVAGTGYAAHMRETHSIGFSHYADGRWAVTNQVGAPLLIDRGGVMFWDLSDTSTPVAAGELEVPGFFYPDAYTRVTLSVSYQAPYVYVAGADNGIYVVDATDPRAPSLAAQYRFEPTLRAGQVIAVGNLLYVSAAEGPRQALLDISDPTNPTPIPGGEFLTLDETSTPRENYFSNVAGGYAWHARKEGGGGLFVVDIHDPRNPTQVGSYRSPNNGGYVFIKDELAFVGESSVANIYDVSDLSNIGLVATLDLVGDLDTMTPIGNVAVLSVDDEAHHDEGTALAPYATDPDTRPPRVTWSVPDDGATGLAATSRVGVTFSEFVDAASAWEGSVRLYETDTDPALTRVDGYISTQDVVVNFAPREPLRPDTEYTFEIPAGGVVDFNGNAIEESFVMTFRTAP